MNRWHPINFDDHRPPDDHEERLQAARLALLPKRLKNTISQALSHLGSAAQLGSWALGEADNKRIAAEYLDEAIALAQELKRLAC